MKITVEAEDIGETMLGGHSCHHFVNSNTERRLKSGHHAANDYFTSTLATARNTARAAPNAAVSAFTE